MLTFLKVSRFQIYKKFSSDIWMFYRSSLKRDKGSRFLYFSRKDRVANRRLRFNRYIYNINVTKQRKRNKKVNRKFNYNKFLVLFYLVLKKKVFVKYINMSLKRDGHFFSNYLLLLEGRIFNIIYRSNYLLDVFSIHKFMLNGLVTLNNFSRTYINSQVNIGDLVKINFFLTKRLRGYLKNNFNRVYSTTPRCLFVDFKFFFSLFYREPLLKDFSFPRNVDVLRGVDFV